MLDIAEKLMELFIISNFSIALYKSARNSYLVIVNVFEISKKANDIIVKMGQVAIIKEYLFVCFGRFIQSVLRKLQYVLMISFFIGDLLQDVMLKPWIANKIWCSEFFAFNGNNPRIDYKSRAFYSPEKPGKLENAGEYC